MTVELINWRGGWGWKENGAVGSRVSVFGVGLVSVKVWVGLVCIEVVCWTDEYCGLCFRALLVHGFATDENGKKMSKSLGNVVDPDTVIDGGKVVTEQISQLLLFPLFSSENFIYQLCLSVHDLHEHNSLVCFTHGGCCVKICSLKIRRFPRKCQSEDIEVYAKFHHFIIRLYFQMCLVFSQVM